MSRAASPLRLCSFAKVNLGLEVLGLRGDGYHELRTVFQTIDLCDRLALRPTPGEVTVTCAHPGVPLDHSNLAARAALELRRFARVDAGVAIEIDKRIPVAGGLGGGSSNAAVVLLGLDHMWKLRLGPAGLLPIARRLGADVPFFLVGGTALGLARGDEVYPLLHQLRARVVVADLRRPVSTADVFREIDARLTPRENSHTIPRFVLGSVQGSLHLRGLQNDLEPAALRIAPDLGEKVAQVRAILLSEGARLAALSGSGSSFFGVFEDAAGARRAGAALGVAGHIAYRSRTLSFSAYRTRTWQSAARGRRRGGPAG